MDPSRSGDRLNRELGLGQVHSDGTHANSIERACLRRCRRSVASVHRQATPITVGDVPVTCDGAPLASRGDHLERRELRREHWEVQKDEVDDGAVVGRDEASGSGSYPVQYSRNRSAWRTFRPRERLLPRRPPPGRNRRRGSRSFVHPRRSRPVRSTHPSRRCRTRVPGRTPPQRRFRAVVRTGGYASRKFSMTPDAAAFENR